MNYCAEGGRAAFPSGGSKVIRGIIARKEGEPGNEANSASVESTRGGSLTLAPIIIYR